MIWKIAKKEFLLNLMTFKFAVGTIVCVVLTAVFAPILAKDYQQRLKDYNDNVSANEAKLREVKVYEVLTPTIYRPPALLSVFAEGLEKRIGNSAKIELKSIPELNAAPTEVNPYLSIFPALDISLIFKVVISLLALLVAYDVISGEREQGTLKLILSNTAARHQVLLGKLIAGLLTLVVPITLTFIVELLVLEFFPMVDLGWSDWARIALTYIASIVFVSAIYNISLLFSCLAKRSAISLILGLFSWVVFVVVVPNGSVYLARRTHLLAPKEKREGQIKALTEKYKSEREEIRAKLPPGGWEYDADGPFGEWYVLLCTPSGAEHWQKLSALMNPLEIKYADKFWEVERTYLGDLFKQNYLAKSLSRISPVSLYGNVASTLAGTDLASLQYFTDNVRVHRNKVIDYIRAKTDNFSVLSYFTPSTQEAREQFEKYARAENWQAIDELKQKTIDNTPSLDLQDFPRFAYRLDVVEGLRRAALDIALLIIANVIFFTLAFVAFINYDVR